MYSFMINCAPIRSKKIIVLQFILSYSIRADSLDRKASYIQVHPVGLELKHVEFLHCVACMSWWGWGICPLPHRWGRRLWDKSPRPRLRSLSLTLAQCHPWEDSWTILMRWTSHWTFLCKTMLYWDTPGNLDTVAWHVRTSAICWASRASSQGGLLCEI